MANHEEHPGGTRPNILVILTDELRAHNLGYAGDSQAHTPRIDALAAESVQFTQAISGEPICCPARASLITGQYPLQHGVFINDVPLEPNGPTIAEVLRDHGYRTGYIGKWHLYGSPEGLYERRESFIPREARFGFEYWKALECTHDYNHSAYYADEDKTKRYWEGYDADAQTQDVLDFIGEEEAADEPYFLMLSFGPPHFPLHTAPERYQRLYEDAVIQLPPNVPDWAREQAVVDLRGYYAHIAAIDDCVGRLMDAIDLDNTIVVFSSDHGDMLWSQGLEHKLTAWEESVRVPLLVRIPGGPPRKSEQLFNSPDFMPTLLGFLGIPIPESVTGLDLSAPVAGPQTAFLSAPAAYSSLRRCGMEEYRGVRNERYTYVRTISGPWLLYDNLRDPFQLHNRCNDPELAVEQAQLERELSQWLKRLGDKFLSGAEYLRRGGLGHYFEANEPLGYSGTDQWRSTNERGRLFTIDTQLSAILENPAARALIEKFDPVLLQSAEPLHERRSIRILTTIGGEVPDPDRLECLDRELMELGPHTDGPKQSVALPAWPPTPKMKVP